MEKEVRAKFGLTLTTYIPNRKMFCQAQTVCQRLLETISVLPLTERFLTVTKFNIFEFQIPPLQKGLK